MNPEQAVTRVELLSAYASRKSVAKLLHVRSQRIGEYLEAGKVPEHKIDLLRRIGLPEIEDVTRTVFAKPTVVRLRAMYAEGISMESLSQWDPQGKPEYLTTRRLHIYISDEVARIPTVAHQWIRRAYAAQSQIPRSPMAEVCRERARGYGWFRPIDLEEDLIDIPEKFAARVIRRRVHEMGLVDMGRSYRDYLRGARSEITNAAYVVYRDRNADLYRQRRIQRRKEKA